MNKTYTNGFGLYEIFAIFYGLLSAFAVFLISLAILAVGGIVILSLLFA
ncbi:MULTISPECIES: hypothetical protein [Neisseria]|jgi:hypothetical protein|nr:MULTISPECIES: hypothetical protein [Neisseria]